MAEVIFPYRTLATAPTLTLSTPRIDGDPVPVMAHEGAVDMTRAPKGWRRAVLQVRVQADPQAMRDVGLESPRAVVTLHCGPSNLRVATALKTSAGQGSMWTGEVELEREALLRRARLEAVVAGTIAGIPDRLAGRSEAVEVYIDEVPSFSFGGGAVRFTWRDFRTSEAPSFDPALHAELSYLDMGSDDVPVIYLNEAVPALRRLLDERPGRSRIERGARDAVFGVIACPAFVAIGNAALAAAIGEATADEVQWPQVEWQRGALEALLPLMYPDRQPEDALVMATQAYTEPLEARELQTRMSAAVAQALKSAGDVGRLLRALESDTAEEETS